MFGNKTFVYLRSDGYGEYKSILGFIGPIIYHFMFSIVTRIFPILSCGTRILKGKKESATPATGKQQKLLTYEGKSQETGLELAKKEIFNPPVKLNKTKKRPLLHKKNLKDATS